MSINLISGEIVYPSLKSGLSNKDYEAIKIQVWFRMLQDGKQPTMFKKANRKGTAIKFDFIKTEEQFNRAFDRFKRHMEAMNRIYGFDFEIEEVK